MSYKSMRSELRFNLEKSFTAEYDGKDYDVVIEDFSEHGVGFRSSLDHYPNLPLGVELDAVFKKENYPTCKLKVVVRHIDVVEKVYPIRIGVQVVGGDLETWSSIRKVFKAEIGA